MPDDLYGRRCGRLTVLDRGPNPYGNGSAFWLCRCDCGTERTVAGYALRKGASRSCGCLRRQTTAKLNRARARVARIAANPAPPEAYSKRTAQRHAGIANA
jgi:hypothetical protein